jgi:hypothetical protein
MADITWLLLRPASVGPVNAEREIESGALNRRKNYMVVIQNFLNISSLNIVKLVREIMKEIRNSY